ncbi:MAG: urease accessory protein UreF [Clostridium sp.]|nr:urease accessory protein UreF [Clostridium sp.]
MNMNNRDAFFTMLQIADSIFPIGAYTQSNGLETYVQKGIVHDSKTAEQYLKSMLKNNYMYNDFLAVKLAYEYMQKGDMEKIKSLDEMLHAAKAPREMKSGSVKMCTRFIKLIEKFYKSEGAYAYKKAIDNGECMGQHSIIYGIFSVEAGIDEEYALKSYFYNMSSCIVNNCVKLIPLGQVDGQKILFEMQEILGGILRGISSLTIDDLGRCCVGFDIKAMQHEDLYSRLYMS